MHEKVNENTVPLEEYNSLEEKMQKMMELIKNNNEAYDINIEKINQKNKRKLEKLMEDLKTKSEENIQLMNKYFNLKLV